MNGIKPNLFIRDVERLLPGRNPMILSGDFNVADQRIGVDAIEYSAVVQAGFSDTYALVNDGGICLNGVCCDPDTGVGCTFAVPGNPFAFNPFTGELETPARIDYIFERGFEDAKILDSMVVFNSDPNWVSDHSAVWTRFSLN